ncbi:PAS domain-containing sensor histidine kinase [Ktedonobacter racemifer]|uniref:histidine kinase n=1 Tax=Ktedonobacter racemifer DSM 44963 TaxID=485913 RepID=D6U1W7_KTERA|nr:PAS domain-containing sensor histidine kinase [Ktedonobacter racemifer]EFH80851.1 PAS/PAC sensor signal transduction histidine kinase [Ktedonobacter racemifer DSM 44963]
MSNPKPTKRLTPASSETLLTLLETLPGALFVVDDAATIVYANASAQSILGATREEVCAQPLWRCAPQLVSTSLYQAVQKTKRTRAPSEVEYFSPVTQTWLHVQLSSTVGGLLLQFHEMGAPAPRQETVPQSEHLYLNGLDGLYSGIVVLTPEGIVLGINEVPLADAQIRREEVIGQPLAQTRWWSCSPPSQEQLRAAIARASMGETVCFETVVHPREGMDRHLEVTITPHMDVEHHIEYLVLAGIDITARKRAEAEIHALIDAIPQLVWTGQPDGYRDSYNQRWRDYTGLSTEEAQGEGWVQCLHPEDRQRVLSMWQRAVQTGGVYETELRLRQGTTGAYRWFLARAMPVRDEGGQIIKWFGTSTDIEKQKRAEQQLKESEENLRVLAETVPQLVWTTRPDGRFDYCNQRYCEYTHAAFEHLQGYGWRQFMHPEDAERVVVLRQQTLQTGEPYEIEYRLRNSQTGTYRWFLARAMPVRDDTGQIIKWFGTCTDIDEQKQAEQKIKESEENWRVLAETVPQLVWTTRSDGQHEYVNQRWCDYTGVTVEHMQSDRWAPLPFIHPDDREGTRTLWQHALETGAMYEHEERLRNSQTGEYRWFLTRGAPVRDDTGQIVKWFGTVTDIDEQKRMEEALRQSQERASVLMNSSIIGIFVAEDERVVDANDAFLRMTGYTLEDLRERRMSWRHMTPPEYMARTLQAHQEFALHQSIIPYEKEYVCKDGSRLPVLVGAVVLQHHPFQAIAFVLDNSARKELEQRKDDFISMASHELRNPLAAVKMQTQLVQKRLERQSHHEAATALSRVEGSVKQLERLIGELLDVSKIQAGRLEYQQEMVDLDALLHEVADTMQQIHTTHTIVVRGTAPCSLVGDKDRLGQVFTNLISNAIKYSPGAETVEMDLSTSAETVTIRVRDHGLGIPREQRDKIFDRFYRVTDPKQRAIPGLGMGLYIVAEIVKSHGGTITVESQVGTGSTFTVTLPKRRDA